VSIPLVGAAELLALLAGPAPPLLLDVRWTLAGPDADAYEAGHLPGAVFVDLDADLAGPPGAGGRHPLPGADAFTATMRRLGVRTGRDVVAYDGGSGAAARAWWCLRYFGHGQVRVLDGGLAAWLAAGGPLKTRWVDPSPASDVEAAPGGMPLLDAEGAARVASAGGLLDARAAERYRGEHEPVDPVAGHVPGANSLPVSSQLRDDGTVRPASEVRALLAEAAGAPTEIASYCGSGVTAAQQVLALDHRAGPPGRAGLSTDDDCTCHLVVWYI
jgi:thiosulfate/3-mercaptopyruvate sulfurtransferase